MKSERRSVASVLFVHQNMPGQFGHLARALAARGDDVLFMTRRRDRTIPGVKRAVYQLAREPNPETPLYLRQTDEAVLHGQAVARTCLALKEQGLRPDLIVAHPGWGEALFLKDIFPDVPLLNYGEFYYRPFGADLNFDPEDPADIDTVCRLRVRNSHLLSALEAADVVLCPTEWQRSVHPSAFHDKIRVVFDGIDAGIVRPDPSARFTLPDGRVLTRADEVVTYVSRNLEPYRGFPTLMRALPALLAARPRAEVVIVGGDETGYGRAPPAGKNWRQTMVEEVEEALRPYAGRVHLLPALPYAAYLQLLQVSRVHVYLTVPFVLSWSMLEAMSAGCLVIASDTAPVREVIVHGVNGLRTDFFDADLLAQRTAEALARGSELNPSRDAARRTVLDRYALDVCLSRQLAVLDDLRDRFRRS